MERNIEPNIYGDIFLGEYTVEQVITNTALRNAIGLVAGTNHSPSSGWLKFLTGEGLTLYVAKRPFSQGISWEQIHAVGAVYGTATVDIQGSTYRVRLLKGANSEVVSHSGSSSVLDPEWSWGSECNRLFYPLASDDPVLRRIPTYPFSGEGLEFGTWGEYTQRDIDLTDGTSLFSWCQEESRTGITSRRICRNGAALARIHAYSSTDARNHLLWRPVLELIE